MQKQIDRVLGYFRNEDSRGIGCIALWTLEEWAIQQKSMTVGSACRHARTLLKNKDLEHPVIDGKVNKHYFKLTEKGRNRKISECPKSYQGVGDSRCWNCKKINNCKYKIKEPPAEQKTVCSGEATVKGESDTGLGRSTAPSESSQLKLF